MAETLSPAGVVPSSAPVLAFPSGHSYASGPGLSAAGAADQRVVAYAIRILADFKVGDREFSGEVDLHSVVCLRRKYEEMGGGSITLRPDWKPALQRLAPLNQEQLKRVLQNMQESFAVARQGGGVLDITSVYFGAEPGNQLKRLHEVMRLQMEAWGKLMERALLRVPEKDRPRDRNIVLAMASELIAPKELEDIARIADPSSDEEGMTIDLPEALAPTPPKALMGRIDESLEDMQKRAAADADAGGDSADAQQALVDRLVAKADLNQQQALSVATLVELMEGDIPDGDLADAIGSKAKGRLDAVRRALKP